MASTQLLVSLGISALLLAGPTLAGNDHRDGHGDHPVAQRHAAHRTDPGMREIVNLASEGEPAYGWRYFSDPAARRAVVISPQGDYYLSRGKGPHRVALGSTAVWPSPSPRISAAVPDPPGRGPSIGKPLSRPQQRVSGLFTAISS